MIAAPESKPPVVASAACSSQADSADFTRIMRVGMSLLGLCLLLWILFYALWRLVPEAIPGSLRVYDAKLDALKKPGLFATSAHSRVLVVGLSYTMTGFDPLLFDTLEPDVCSTFNFGLPVTLAGRRVYTLDEILDMLRKSGNIPTDILVTWREPWPPAASQPEPAPWKWITPKWDSDLAMQKLFPFKQLGRDGLIFILRAFSHGGPASFRQTCNNEVSKMLHDRGYYFLKANSIYPNDELPADFCGTADSPKVAAARDIKVWEEFVAGLRGRAGRPRILLVPNYYRENSCAPAPTNGRLREALRKHGVEVVGPDYFQYPNHLFSDAAHLNRTGADVYTRDLWALLKDHLGN